MARLEPLTAGCRNGTTGLPNTEALRDCFGERANVNLETRAGLAKTKIEAELIDERHQKTQSKSIAADEIIVAERAATTCSFSHM
ncbi:MAG: hypothetical protein IIA27_14385 [Gemmatimonadetes bacterium]|nr:hypothetical protein [Gemmatimonadota bacterium]